MIPEIVRSHLPSLLLGIIIGKYVDMTALLILGVVLFFMINEPFGKSKLAPRDFLFTIVEKTLRLFEKKICTSLEDQSEEKTPVVAAAEQRHSTSSSQPIQQQQLMTQVSPTHQIIPQSIGTFNQPLQISASGMGMIRPPQ